jgi:hypothetical protein
VSSFLSELVATTCIELRILSYGSSHFSKAIFNSRSFLSPFVHPTLLISISVLHAECNIYFMCKKKKGIAIIGQVAVAVTRLIEILKSGGSNKKDICI